MMSKLAITAILGSALAASTANAQFQVGVDVGSSFGSVPLVGTPSYYVSPYDSYYYSAPGYYSTYSTGPSFYVGTPGLSIGIGNGYYGGWGRSYYGGWNGGWNRGYYGGRGYYRGGRWR